MIEKTTVRRLLVCASMLTLTGCAQEGVSRPSFLGLSDLAVGDPAEATPAAPDKEIPEALRHVQSNKVLSAMAFQKVTGQTVDPESLSGRGE
jgi:hypothetical protein